MEQNAQPIQRLVEVPEDVWDAIVDIMASAAFSWPDDKNVQKVVQFIKAED